MATHSSILAWKSPWTEEPPRLQSVGRKVLDTTERLTHKHKRSGAGRRNSQREADKCFLEVKTCKRPT